MDTRQEEYIVAFSFQARESPSNPPKTEKSMIDHYVAITHGRRPSNELLGHITEPSESVVDSHQIRSSVHQLKHKNRAFSFPRASTPQVPLRLVPLTHYFANSTAL